MIQIFDDHKGDEFFDIGEMISVSTYHLDAEERVPGLKGRAVDWDHWYKSWAAMASGESYLIPTHLKIIAVDGRTAVIPWDRLRDAMFVYETPENGTLETIHFVVPGEDERMNLPNVMQLNMIYNMELSGEPEYGRVDEANTANPLFSEAKGGMAK
ncbi:hypothetical protein ACVNS2_25740 [Paenibacillus caseinilyticus]|uniref:Uncharacterized protein n=1 Tax=Paenibacillus mucilaginosus K02 TaxID=997761 RepID=I0BNY4_9BACL|nr:hypothetical protein [Paenibacillus mucilaginosus]AFH64081.1 hypothetical protein B2K_25915 [Paenibacillus mucilaginosus K02]